MLNLLAKDFKRLFSAQGGFKKKLLSMLGALFMAGFVVGIEWFLFSAILEKIQNFQGATRPLLTLFLFIISCLTVFMDMVQANRLFFDQKDIEQLIRRPVSNAQIISSKLVFLFFTHYFTTLLLVYPIFLAYGNMVQKLLAYYYAAIFYPALSFLFEAGLALVLVYPYKLASDFLKKHTLVQFILALVVIFGACVVYNYVLNLFMEMVVNGNINVIFTVESIESLTATRQYLVPINLLTDVFAFSMSVRLLPYLGIAGGIFICGVAIVVFAFNYLRSVAIHAKPGKVKEELNITNPTTALLKKELFLLFKDSNNIFSFTGLLIVQPFLVYIVINSLNSVFRSGIFAFYLSMFEELIPLVDVLIVMMFTLIINQGATTFIQTEKGNVRLMKILPVSPLKQLAIKVLVPFSLSAVSLLISVVILLLTKEVNWITALFAALLTLILLTIFDLVSLKEEMKIGNNRPRSTMLSTCYSYLLPVAFFAAAVLSCAVGLPLWLAYVVGVIVFLGLGAPHFIKLPSRIKALFLDLEMVN